MSVERNETKQNKTKNQTETTKHREAGILYWSRWMKCTQKNSSAFWNRGSFCRLTAVTYPIEAAISVGVKDVKKHCTHARSAADTHEQRVTK